MPQALIRRTSTSSSTDFNNHQGTIMLNQSSTSTRITRRLLLTFTASALFASAGAFAAPPINTLKNSVFGGNTDTAINGYDTVAYFTQSKPVKGTDALATEWQGAKWKFSTQANLDLFKASPEKYAPQYGGYCAYGVTQGALVKVDPDQFSVIDGKLYLNFDADVQAKWKKDTAGYIASANVKFPALLKK
jgi:YHS domain-containing protein